MTATTAEAATSMAAEQQQAGAQARAAPEAAPGAPFSYTRQWWPLAAADYIDPARPHPVELLGKKVVLWRDGGGAWRAMEDACPHRLAPLSEGRLENGQLECSYHGWRFDGCGRCTRIPQAVDSKAEATACGSARSRVAGHPVREAAGILWVWGDASPAAEEEAAAAPLPVPRCLEESIEATGRAPRWYRRELPYSWDVLIENVVDPAHLPHSHHKLTPVLTRDKSGPMPFSPVQPPAAGPQQQLQQEQEHAAASEAASPAPAQAAEGAAAAQFALPHAAPVGAFAFPSALSPAGTVAFSPPATVTYEYKLPGPGDARMWTLIYATPAGPGRSVVLTSSVSNRPPATWGDFARALLAGFNVKAALGTLMRLRFQSIPSWRAHMISNKLFDMDNVFLHQQDLLLERRGRGAWARDYYMPVPCDGLVVAARRWIDGPGGGGPPYAPGAAPLAPLPKRALQDRWAQHTASCSACQEAERKLRRAGALAAGAAAGLFAALCALLGTFGAPRLLAGGWPGAAAVVAAVGVVAALVRARQCAADAAQFGYVGFDHWSN